MGKKGIILLKGNDKVFNLLKKFFVFWTFLVRRLLLELSLYSGSVDLFISVFKKCVFNFVRFKYVFFFFSCKYNAYILSVKKYINVLKKKVITQWVDFMSKYFAKISKWFGMHFVDKKFNGFDYFFRKKNVEGFGRIELLRLFLMGKDAQKKKYFFGKLGVLLNYIREFAFFRYYGLNMYGFKKYFKVSNYLFAVSGHKNYMRHLLSRKDFLNKIFLIFCSPTLTSKFFRKVLFKGVNMRNLRLYRFTIYKFLIHAFELKVLYIHHLRHLFMRSDFNFYYNVNVNRNTFFAYRKRNYGRIHPFGVFYKFLVSNGGFDEMDLFSRRFSFLLDRNFFFVRKFGVSLVKKKLVKTFFFTRLFLRSARARRSIKPGPGKLNRFRQYMFYVSLSKRHRLNRMPLGMYRRLQRVYMMAIGDRRMFYYRRNKSRFAYYKFKKVLARWNRYRVVFKNDGDFDRKFRSFYKWFTVSKPFRIFRKKINKSRININFRGKIKKARTKTKKKIIPIKKFSKFLKKHLVLRKRMARVFDGEKKFLLLNLKKTKGALKNILISNGKMEKNFGKNGKEYTNEVLNREKVRSARKFLVKRLFYSVLGLRNALFVLRVRRLLVKAKKLTAYLVWFKVCFFVKEKFNNLMRRIRLAFFKKGVKSSGLKNYSSVDKIYNKLGSSFFSLAAKVFILCVVNWKYYSYFKKLFIKIEKMITKKIEYKKNYKKRRVLPTAKPILGKGKRKGTSRLLWYERVKQRKKERKKAKKAEIFVFYRKTKTNLFWTAVDFFGNVLLWMSIGRAGFKGAALRTELASKTSGEIFAKKLKDYKLTARISLFVRFRISRVIKESLRAFWYSRIRFRRVFIQIIRSHNGLRKRSVRRV